MSPKSADTELEQTPNRLFVFCTATVILMAFVIGLFFYRHLTINSQVPWWRFFWERLLSALVWAAISAIVGTIAGIIIEKLTSRRREDGTYIDFAQLGKVAKDSPPEKEGANQKRRHYIINAIHHFLGVREHAVPLISIAASISVALAGYMRATPPSFHSKFIKSIIHGTSDNYAQARAMVEQVARMEHNDMAEGYKRALDVLCRRSDIAYEGERLNPGEVRPLMQSLTTLQSGRWKEHPLRWYALAEIYAIYAQQTKQLMNDCGLADSNNVKLARCISRFVKNSLSCFDLVLQTRDVLSTREFKRYVMLKKGNVLAYLGDYIAAHESWELACRACDQVTPVRTQKHRVPDMGNLGSTDPLLEARSRVLWGLVLNKKARAAVDMGEEMGKRARIVRLDTRDPFVCAVIYANTALAEWIDGNCDDALANSLEAVVVHDSLITRMCFAYALIRKERKPQAERYLRSFMTPVTPENLVDVIKSPSGQRQGSGYLLWILADADAARSVQVARLYATLGEAREAAEIRAMNGQDVSQLVGEVVRHVAKNAGVCFDLMLVPSTTERLDELAKKWQITDNEDATRK